MMRSRHPRGYVLILVLAVLLILSLLVASYFSQTQEASVMTRLAMGQALSLRHAQQGCEDAVRAVRGAQFLPLPAVDCTSAQVAANICPDFIQVPGNGAIIDNGQTLELSNQGGLQYQYVVYKRSSAGDPAQPDSRYVIQCTGYYGYTLTSNDLITSQIEVEFDNPTAKLDTGLQNSSGGNTLNN